jgi:hypothetical protein
MFFLYHLGGNVLDENLVLAESWTFLSIPKTHIQRIYMLGM